MSPLITLTTDFGDASPYVAVMKGVILSLNPAARLLDLSHRVRAQDVRHADYFLGTAVPYFPAGTVHVAVVDPGVGSDRHPLAIEAGGQFLVGPDNGVFTRAVKALGTPVRVRRLAEPRYWRPTVSDTFHGRDVFAPVAAHLTLGTDPAAMGPVVGEMVELKTCSAVCWGSRRAGEVQFVDGFGNLITNIPAAHVRSPSVRVSVGGADQYPVRCVRTYSDAPPGELVALASSDGFVEIAEVNGSAARRLRADVGTAVELHFE
jgi:S-adenosylmethionine hydrolase